MQAVTTILSGKVHNGKRAVLSFRISNISRKQQQEVDKGFFKTRTSYLTYHLRVFS